MSMSKGRSAVAIVFSILLVVVLLFRLLFLFIALRLRSRIRSGRFYRAMRRSGLDRGTAKGLLAHYRKHNTISFRKLVNTAFEGRQFPYGISNKKIY